MKLKCIIDDPVQGNNFLHNAFGINATKIHKDVKYCFACQDTKNPMSASKLYSNYKL